MTGARAHGQHQGLAGARAGSPDDVAGDLRDVRGLGAAGADQAKDRLDHAVADRHAADQELGLLKLGRGHRLGRLFLRHAGGGDQHAPLGFEIGVGHVDLHQEAVELRFGQRIGAFLLQRVLGRQHGERRRQVVIAAGDRDAVLLHRLQQGRLRARAGAVDLVGHQQLAEDGAGNEAERAPAGVRFPRALRSR